LSAFASQPEVFVSGKRGKAFSTGTTGGGISLKGAIS
jgi:hypothetical protein